MKFMGYYAALGVLGLFLSGCGQNQSNQTPYPGAVGYPSPGGVAPGGSVIPGGGVISGGGIPSSAIGPNGQPLPQGGALNYSPGNPGQGGYLPAPSASGQGSGLPNYRLNPGSSLIGQGQSLPNGALPNGQGQPYYQGNGTIDGPVVSPNPGALNPNASAIPPQGQLPNGSGNANQSLPNGGAPVQPTIANNGQQPGIGNSGPLQPSTQLGPQTQPQPSTQLGPQTQPAPQLRPQSEALTYFSLMEVWDFQRSQVIKALPGESAAQFVRLLYTQYPSFNLDQFDTAYRAQHKANKYGAQAVQQALRQVGCNDEKILQLLAPAQGLRR